MLKLQEIFTTVAKVCHRYGRLAVLQNVFAIILHGAKRKEKTLKNSSKKRYTRKIKEKKEAETKSNVQDLKKALTRTNPRTVKRYEASMFLGLFFFSDHFMKQVDSMLPWVCSVTDHRGRLNKIKSRHYGHLLIIAVYSPPHCLWVPMSLLYNSRYNGTSSGRFRYLELQLWTKVLRTVMQYSCFAVISQFRHKTVHPFSKFSCRSPSPHPIQS